MLFGLTTKAIGPGLGQKLADQAQALGSQLGRKRIDPSGVAKMDHIQKEPPLNLKGNTGAALEPKLGQRHWAHVARARNNMNMEALTMFESMS